MSTPVSTLDDCGRGIANGCLVGLALDIAVVAGVLVLLWVML